MLSHTAIDQKTEYSLAKYKLLKTRKVYKAVFRTATRCAMLDYWILRDKDASKIMDMRDEMVALLGCWANVILVDGSMRGPARGQNKTRRRGYGYGGTRN